MECLKSYQATVSGGIMSKYFVWLGILAGIHCMPNFSCAGTLSIVPAADAPKALVGQPLDPGGIGKETLEGIDSDHDGVRDDVQRWIAVTFPGSEKTKEALRQATKTMQRFMLDADDAKKSYANALQMGKDTDCLAYIRDDYYRVCTEHKAIFLNTYMRTKAWLRADHQLSGIMFSGSDYGKNGCQFDVDGMPLEGTERVIVSNQSSPTPLPESQNDIPLPPDWGALGMQTVEGIDSDSDGVRDDVQRWIVKTYPNSGKTRAAYFQRTKTMQRYILEADTPENAHALAVQMGRDSLCLSYVQPKYGYIEQEYRGVVLNSTMRSDAWLYSSQKLRGQNPIMLNPTNPGQWCNFNPDDMPD